jgi:cytochrome c553
MKKIALTMLFAGVALMAADGKALYAKCAGCHGQDGKTKALGKSAPIAGMAVDTLVKAMEGYKAGTLNTYGMGGVMKGQVAALSADDMKALAEYINKLGK